MAHLALQLCASTVSATPQLAVPRIKGSLMPKALTLLQSSVLQGYALRSLLAFLGELVRQDVAELNFDAIMAQLLALAADGSMSKHALSALSQAIGVCCTSVTDAPKRDAMVTKFVTQLKSAGGAQQRTLALL